MVSWRHQLVQVRDRRGSDLRVVTRPVDDRYREE